MSKAKNAIVLVGFMGTGKSSVSKLLSERLGFMRVDLDDEIEKFEGRKISDIFTESGEPAFREIECKVLASILMNGERKIIATGGGAVLNPHNRDLMLTHGWVVSLTADARHIIERVRNDHSRPLLQGGVEERVNKLLEQRKHAYDFADFSVDTSRMTTEEVADCIIRQWEEHA
ncbi:shikimate kinase [Paenibacillus abyssi]|uniref:Shikimate kinase n=1 Tax=Paenibacillus abyssi TaxID=1340531 RepID=A0A917D4B0_9BACL|nr:shikimate kinase [Paenibacillus abyssi]GGG09493.1 shikimate kinase [Paenibacillus abyssi]